MAAPRLMSVDDYFKTPETVKPMELVYRRVRVADSPLPRHQAAVAQLFRALDAHVRAHDLGEMWLAPLDVVLNEARALIVQPDLFFISHNRAWIVTDRVRGAPDLVIEVLSPEPRIGRTDERIQWFAEHGVRECWLVHQDERSIAVIEFARPRVGARHVYRRHDPMKSVVLPDFDLRVDDILMA